jgi:catechol 2,3-dioxygenase-like lactoylglutathione lyase family enzyme
MLQRIDHMVAVVPELAAGAAPYERLGLVLTPETRHVETGAANRACFVGESAESYSYLELLSVFDEGRARASGREHYIEAANTGGGMVALAFGVADIEGVSGRLAVRGYDAPLERIHRADGSLVGEVAQLSTDGALPFRATLISYPETFHERYDRSLGLGRFAHTFPLKRLDHLAAITPDIEAATRFWEEVLEVTVSGEISTPQMVIRQLKIGDAILELLGPATTDSPLASRDAALISMAAWEVAGPLDEAVALARERGFTVSDPESGVIPGTRRASIPATELGGVGMQLLEYV